MLANPQRVVLAKFVLGAIYAVLGCCFEQQHTEVNCFIGRMLRKPACVLKNCRFSLVSNIKKAKKADNELPPL